MLAGEPLADGLQIIARIEAFWDRNCLAERLAVAQIGRAREHFDLGAGVVDVIFARDLEAGEVEQVRQRVTEHRAAAVADDALAEVLPMVSEGRTEAEVALALDSAMRRLGAEESAFETIVASGPNAAKPHARPSERRLERGDPVVIDFGALYEGYRSDMTRTFFVGAPPTGVMAEVLEVVARAQEAGVAAVRAGAVSGEVDQAARRVVTEAGYGQAFEHGTGHGVGLDIHEAPWVGAGTTAILQSGTVVTVEPGVYLSGIGGVRIEDTVVVTDTGCRPLTRFPKDPVC